MTVSTDGDTTTGPLVPPFSSDRSALSLSAGDCLADLPACITARGKTFRPAREVPFFLRTQLETWRIDLISDYLWYIQVRRPVLPLHRQVVSRRTIVATESPSEHLVSDYSVLFVKPLPAYLLSHQFWERHLSHDKSLHSAACGLLLSYTWIVVYQSDFDIAKQLHLLPSDLSWRSWTALAANFLDSVEASPTRLFSDRYSSGELQMSRLNYLFKIKPALWSKDNPLRGFMPTSMWNKSFKERNITRLLGVFVFFSLILSAMQVGLATSQLQENQNFVAASYGFAVTCLFVVLFCGFIGLAAISWHVRYKILRPWQTRIWPHSRELG